MAGIFVKFWKPFKGTDGKIGKTADQLLFPGTLQQFRERFRGVCVIGYHAVDDDGTVLENSCVMLNEPYVPPPKLAEEIAFNEGLKAMANAAEGPQKPQGTAPQAVVQPQPQPPAPAAAPQIPRAALTERIYESGDSFIKIAGDKVYQLRWKEYDDSQAPFDQRVRIAAGDNGVQKVEITVWEELSPGEVRK